MVVRQIYEWNCFCDTVINIKIIISSDAQVGSLNKSVLPGISQIKLTPGVSAMVV